MAPGNGRLVQEIFTRDGAGTLISRDLYDGIRPATVADVPGIIDIIEPLVQEGVLTRRSRKDLEHDVGQYYVFTRDGLIVACGQLRKYVGGRWFMSVLSVLSCLVLAVCVMCAEDIYSHTIQ